MTLIVILIQLQILLKKKKLHIIEGSRNEIVSKLGNILDTRVPVFKDEDKNKPIFEKQNKVDIDTPENLYNHVVLCEKLDLTDTIKGSNIAGNRGYFLKHYGVLLNNAIIRYAMDFLVERDYKLLYTPFFMKKEMMSKVAQLNEFDEK